MEKLVITCAITGSQTTRKDTPYLPITPKEIADSAIGAYRAGASIAHIHVRGDDGVPVQEVQRFQEVAERIRAETDMIVEVSTGGHHSMPAEERICSVDIEPPPEMASFNAGSMNFGSGIFINSPEALTLFARRMHEKGVKPEFECFDCGMIENVLRLIDQGTFTPPYHFSFVLGVSGGIGASPKNLLHMVESIRPGDTWSVVGIGRHQLPLVTMAMVMEGHVRVGLEDNVFLSKGTLAKSNAELVEKVVRLANELGRPVATAREARQMLGLPGLG